MEQTITLSFLPARAGRSRSYWTAFSDHPDTVAYEAMNAAINAATDELNEAARLLGMDYGFSGAEGHFTRVHLQQWKGARAHLDQLTDDMQALLDRMHADLQSRLGCDHRGHSLIGAK